MAGIRSLNPLSIGRRKNDSYTALDGQYVDPEKRITLDSPYASSPTETNYSSRDVSGSNQGLLRRSSSASRKASAMSYSLPRRRFSRYFTLALGTTLVLFMLSLTRSAWVAQKKVELGIAKPPPKPAAWEDFPFLERYHGGIRTLVTKKDNKPEYPDPDNNTLQPEVKDRLEQQQKKPVEKKVKRGAIPAGDKFDPYPDYKSDAYKNEFEPKEECYLDKKEKVQVPKLLAYKGVPKGFPEPIMGSHELLGLNNDVCFERFGRLGPYGLGYSRKWGGSGAGMEGDREGAENVWGEQLEIDYRDISWSEAQERCAERNRLRFKPKQKGRNHFFQTMAAGGPDMEPPSSISGKEGHLSEPDAEGMSNVTERSPSGKKLLPRTAVIIRTWWDYQYDYEDLFYLRALINELSIQSGGEYTIHFLIHVKDDNMQIWADDETYQRVLDNALPTEFKGMGTLWSERQMGLIYGGVEESFYRDLPVHGAYRSTYMPVQYFAHQHPEYDFFWHWEMDIRYTGHFYHFFDKVSKWAAQQPRKGLWERNGRFYVPSEHGSWEDFKQMVRVQTEHGTAHKSNIYAHLPGGTDTKSPLEAGEKPETPIWGPLPPTGEGEMFDASNDPVPPTTYDKDKYTWGVGEEADFITFNPLFDPERTNWILAEDVTGYNTSAGMPPRRTAIITASRLSRRLLETMHRETALQRHTMFSEMWPGSAALHHVMKAVYAPHPVYIDRRWPTSYLAAIFNNGRNGAAGGARTSVFSDERQHNFLGTTWYYHAGFSANLWKRWLGYKVDNDGGEEWETREGGEGRMCVPAMLLHPVKQVDLVYEHQEGE
ncbi:hypothetical protein M8818_002260 [Zalaria obscura]|uniref:Uncharacterized protein n=1 Tax=Zalaria obscura TaxID=2024903 RepID=A0ACC3SLH8_9PEZI